MLLFRTEQRNEDPFYGNEYNTHETDTFSAGKHTQIIYQVCSNNQVGCLEFEDCGTGLFCDTSITQPKCIDFDECDPKQQFFNGLSYCGEQTSCTNTVGSLSCSCKTGYVDWKANEGCRDKNECTEVGRIENCNV